MSLYRDRGVVLRSIRLGEADRIVTILTEAQGKVRAVAKGVRRPGSRFGARLEPTMHLAMQCYRGRELDVVTQVETIDAFRGLREHYGSLTHAVAMLEAVDQVAQERERNAPLYRMLVGALGTLATAPSPVVAPVFLWKLLGLEGVAPELDACVRCGARQGPFPALDLLEGGLLCVACGRHAPGFRPEADTVELLRAVAGGELRRVLAEPPAAATVAEAERIAVTALEHHVERRLKSAALL